MEISFKFNNGETAQEIVAAITALFGIAAAAQPVTYQGAAQQAPQTLHPADNPAAGADPEDTGAASTATHDAEGSPWDARIHSDKKTMTEKGVWRKRKGVAPPQIASVQAELRAQGKYVAVGVPAAAPAMPAAAPAMPALAMPALAVPAAPPLPAAPVDTPYTIFVNFVAGNLHSATNPAGRITEQWVSDALKSLDVVDAAGNGSIAALQHADAERIKTVHNTFAQALGVPGV